MQFPRETLPDFSERVMATSSSEGGSLFNIEKLNGTNFPFWKEQIYNVLVQKKQVKPIKQKGIKPEDMGQDDWDELDELARSTIMLTLTKSVYFNVKEMKTTYMLWEKLCGLYEQKSAASQVYWLKQLVDLKMKEGTAMSSHLNDFNTIFSNLSAQDVEFEDSVKALFLLITLPESWDIFCTAISNSAPAGGLTATNVESSLLTEEVNRKNLNNTRGGSALVVRGRSDKKKGPNKNKSKSKSRERSAKDMECYHCGKKGHYKRDCRLFKQEKGKDKEKEDKPKEKESINAVEEVSEPDVSSDEYGEICFTSNLESAELVTTDDNMVMHDWILDSGASFHVTPHREWFTNYDASRTGRVRLGNYYACEIEGVGDVQLKFQQGSTYDMF